jgi:glutaredoxin
VRYESIDNMNPHSTIDNLNPQSTIHNPQSPIMIIVYGADWCEDTRRSLRLLRRLHIAHQYVCIDDDLEALQRAKSWSNGKRRTPTVDLGLGGTALVEPDNDTLTGALVEVQMLTRDEAHERLGIQNVGDVERIARTAAGLLTVAAASAAPRSARWPVGIAGLVLAGTGLTGWCPAYYAAGVTSLGGPGDRPDEAERRHWIVSRRSLNNGTVAEAPIP